MPSTFSTNLKIELMATGENSGTWGTVTNTNLGTALEQAVVGYGNPNYSSDANLTITLTDSNAAQAARALVLNVTSGVSLSATRELVVPTIQKQYIVQNNTTGSQSITVKTSAGTGVTIPNGKKMHVYVNGTDVVQMDDFALIFNVDNLTLDGNTLSSTDTNGNIVIAPNGTGDVQLDADTVRVGDSNANATITTNGTGDLILNTNAGTNSGSITIEDGVNGNIIIAPNGTGQVQITNAALDLTTIEVSNINAKDGTAAITIADSTGAVGISTAVTMSATTQNIALGTSQTTGTWTAGGASQTGALTLDQSTKTHTLNLGTGATESGLTKTINLGTGGVSTSTTAITIGSTNGTTTTLNGTVTAATLNSTTIDTTNIEVTNIKAKDGTAALSIADSTGVVSVSANPVLSGGTANGVAYLDGSKVLTTGSALTFDGSVLTLGTSTALPISGSKFSIGNDANSALRLAITNQNAGASALVGIDFEPAGGGWKIDVPSDTTSFTPPMYFKAGAGTNVTFAYGGNVGIGTTSPQRRIHGYIATGPVARMQTNGSNAAIEYVPGATDGTGSIYNWVVGAQYNVGNAFEITPSTAAGGLTFSSPALVVTSGGNLGVGTNSPGARLDVNGSKDATNLIIGAALNTVGGAAYVNYSELLFKNTAGANSDASIRAYGNVWNIAGSQLAFFTANNSAVTERMRLDNSGNLGLGVTPSAWYSTGYSALQVRGSSLYGTTGNDTNLASNAFLNTSPAWAYVSTGTATRYEQGGGTHKWYNAPSGTAGNAITFTQAMTLGSDGNLAVGESSTANARLFSYISSNSVPSMVVRQDGTAAIQTWQSSGGAEKARITSGGNFGIGETNPQSQLSLTEVTANTTTRSDQIRIQAESSGTTGVGFGANIYFVGERNGGTLQAMGRIGFGASTNTVSNLSSDFIVETANNGTPAERARITSSGVAVFRNGPVGAGQTAAVKGVQIYFDETNNAGYIYSTQSGVANYPLYILGDEVYVGGTTDNGAYNFQCNGTGVWGAGAYVNGSDAKLKDNIQTLNDGLAVVEQLRPVTFQYKPEHSKDQSVQPGFIAQELQQAMSGKPYLDGVVQSGPEYLSVAYQNLIPILTKAIQEQQAMINELKAEMAALKGV